MSIQSGHKCFDQLLTPNITDVWKITERWAIQTVCSYAQFYADCHWEDVVLYSGELPEGGWCWNTEGAATIHGWNRFPSFQATSGCQTSCWLQIKQVQTKGLYLPLLVPFQKQHSKLYFHLIFFDPSWQGNAAWAWRGTKSNACDAEVMDIVHPCINFFWGYQYLQHDHGVSVFSVPILVPLLHYLMTYMHTDIA